MTSENVKEKIIKSECDDDSEKENEIGTTKGIKKVPPILRQPRTTKAQFEKIAAFMDEHSEVKSDKVTFDLLWDDLAATLNDIGPPDHTTSEWRRIWSIHKSNKKRKQWIESDDEESESFLHSDQPSCSNVGLEGTSTKVPNNADESPANFDVVIKNQIEMIANQKLIIKEIECSNKLLEQIAKQNRK